MEYIHCNYTVVSAAVGSGFQAKTQRRKTKQHPAPYSVLSTWFLCLGMMPLFYYLEEKEMLMDELYYRYLFWRERKQKGCEMEKWDHSSGFVQLDSFSLLRNSFSEGLACSEYTPYGVQRRHIDVLRRPRVDTHQQ